MCRAPFFLLVALLLVPRVTWPLGDPIGPEFRVNTYTSGGQGGSGGYKCACENGSSVAADAGGNFVVVWHSEGQDGSSYGVFGQRYANDGVPSGSEFQVNTYTTDDQRYPVVAADSSGNFVVVWVSDDQDGSARGVFGQRYSSSGNPLGPEFRVNAYTTGFQLFPSVAADSSGRFVVVWGNATANYGVFGQRYDSSGAPLGPEFRVNTYSAAGQRYPSVAADSAGNFVVVWQSYNQDGSKFGVFGQRYANTGSPLGPEFRVNTSTTGQQLYPAVDTDSIGNFVVVWNTYPQDGSGFGVFGQRYASSGAALGSEFQVDVSGFWHPEVAADSSGNFVVVASAGDGYFGGIVGKRFASSGAPLGSEFRVNTYTTEEQRNAVVAADSGARGNFVIVWPSRGQDGSYWGVYGQRYGQIVPIELMQFAVE